MAEKYMRCRFYPRCSIHPGDPRPRHFSPDNITEMRSMRLNGWDHDEIAEHFGTSAPSVIKILGGQKK